MSVKFVAEEVRRFLSSGEPEAICIIGKWGVGKTFAWNQYLKAAISEKSVALPRYSYVSLFGQNSLQELKYAIFENTVAVEQVDGGANLNTLRGAVSSLETLVRKGAGYFIRAPKINEYASLFARSFFLAVRNQVVCIDDLERIGDGLSTKDVLGLVSFLKDQRGCKVVLLLNDEELSEQGSKDFETQLEKVVDVEMRFEPTPEEAAEIGIDKSTSFHESLAKVCIGLGIVNIRVIQKIQRLLRRLEQLLQHHDKRVFAAALPSVALFCWAKYQPQLAPSLDFIKDFNPYSHLLRDAKPEDEKDKSWRELLGAINFTNFDEFDELLLKSVKKGYFDSGAIEKAAAEFDRKLKLQDQDNSFSAAWEKYHGSFANNGDEVLDEMFRAFKSGVQAISPLNVDGTVGLFRQMGRDAQADEMISYYIANRDEKRDFFDSSRSMFMSFKDEKLAKAFAEKFATFKDERAPKDILINIAKHSGWNPEDITTLSDVSPDEYYKLFKATQGDDLRIVVSQALKMRRYGQADTRLETISSNAEDALKRIAKESKINGLRVASYGITLEEQPKKE